MCKRILVQMVVASLIVAGVMFLVLRRRPPHPVAVGEPAPDFTLPTLAQGSLRLRDYRHQVVVLNFWATWCPPCVEETPSLRKFAEQMQGQKVVIIGVSVDQDERTLQKFVADAHLPFPIVRDPDQRVASRFGTYQFPETYILDRDGRVAEKIIGAIDWQDSRMISFVQALAGNRLRPASWSGAPRGDWITERLIGHFRAGPPWVPRQPSTTLPLGP